MVAAVARRRQSPPSRPRSPRPLHPRRVVDPAEAVRSVPWAGGTRGSRSRVLCRTAGPGRQLGPARRPDDERDDEADDEEGPEGAADRLGPRGRAPELCSGPPDALREGQEGDEREHADADHRVVEFAAYQLLGVDGVVAVRQERPRRRVEEGDRVRRARRRPRRYRARSAGRCRSGPRCRRTRRRSSRRCGGCRGCASIRRSDSSRGGPGGRSGRRFRLSLLL